MMVLTRTAGSAIFQSRGESETWMESRRVRSASSLRLYTLLYTRQIVDSTILTKIGGSLLAGVQGETLLVLGL